MAWLPQGIAGPKVAGFVSEQQARVLRVHPDELRLGIGQPPGWLPWSRQEDELAVELTIQLNRETQCVRSLTHVIVELKPLGGGNDEARRERLNEIVCALRYRLLAQDLELA